MWSWRRPSRSVGKLKSLSPRYTVCFASFSPLFVWKFERESLTFCCVKVKVWKGKSESESQKVKVKLGKLKSATSISPSFLSIFLKPPREDPSTCDCCCHLRLSKCVYVLLAAIWCCCTNMVAAAVTKFIFNHNFADTALNRHCKTKNAPNVI